jgi:hypothetical protein
LRTEEADASCPTVHTVKIMRFITTAFTHYFVSPLVIFALKRREQSQLIPNICQ